MTAPAPGADFFRDLERRRTQALVARDIALAKTLHAPEYQLVTPGGRTFTRDEYLRAIESGDLHYVSWEPEEIQVRISPAMALVRYRAVLAFPSGSVVRLWHLDSYEERGGAWQAVWSQATAIPEAK